jgi:hypothetical protein
MPPFEIPSYAVTLAMLACMVVIWRTKMLPQVNTILTIGLSYNAIIYFVYSITGTTVEWRTFLTRLGFIILAAAFIGAFSAAGLRVRRIRLPHK